MSRLGDLIRLERTRRELTHKQVAKKSGVSEKYLKDVEAGTRIIADDQARRILKTMGMVAQTEADFTLDDIAATVDLHTTVTKVVAQEVKKSPAPKTEPTSGIGGSIWLDALSGVLKHVPVYNAVMKKVSHRLLPVLDGKIEDANPDKVFYYLVPDNEMRGFRVMKDDLLLIVPATAPIDGAVMLLQTKSGHILRKVNRMQGFQIMLQKFDNACESEVVNMNELMCVGRAVRLEAQL